MSDPSNTHHEQAKEIAALKERIRELEAIEAEYKREEKTLARSEKKFRKLFNAVTDAVMLLGENGFFECNKAALSIFGCRTREEFFSKSPADLSPVEQPDGTDSRVLANRMIATAMEKGSFNFKWMHKRNDTGETFPADVQFTAMELDGKPVVYAVVRDITEHHKAEEALRESEAKFRAYMEKAPLGIFVADKTGRYIEVNPTAYQMTGYTKEELLNLTIPDFLAPEFLDKGMALFKKIKAEGSENGDFIVRRKNGEKFWINLVAATITDDRIIAFCQDITENQQAKEKIRQMAYHDSLTGLPNRKLFSDRAGIALAQAERNQSNVAFIMLDLDNFKAVNDTLGHDAGDFLLKTAAERLNAAMRKSDTVARFGGDEFVLLVSELKSKEDAARLAQKIVDRFHKAILINARQLIMTASIGVAVYPDDGLDEETLLKNADIAMYQAKQAGRDRYHVFS